MTTFYKQTTSATEPSGGTYTDIAIFKDGSIKICNEDGDFVEPFSTIPYAPYIKTITTENWADNDSDYNDASYKLVINEGEHHKGSHCVVTAVYKNVNSDGTVEQVLAGSIKDTSGNITIFSDEKIDGLVYIDRVYPQINHPEGRLAQVWCGSLNDYNSLTEKDSSTIYLITS